MAKDYFVDIFKTVSSSNVEHIMSVIPRCVTQVMNDTFTKPVEDKEIVKAFNQMDPRKALGCDGLFGLFSRRTGILLAMIS